MLDALASAFSTVLGAVGSFVKAITGTAGTGGVDLSSILPLFAIGIAVSLLYAAIRGVRKMTWGA